MFAIRCTRKLLNRGAPEVLEAQVPPTTVLGDWYANIIFTRPEHLVVCISERTLLPVVVTAKNLKKLPIRVAAAVKEVLIAIGVPLDLIEEEMRQMQNGYLAVTNSRKILGSLNDFMYHFERSYHERQGLTIQEHAIRLANTPFAAIEYAYASEATRAQFASSQAISAAKSAA